MVVRLALLGFVVSVLTLSLPEATSPVAGETMSVLRVIALRSAVLPALSHAAEPSLTTAARLTARCDAHFTRDDYDWDDDNASDMLPRILSAYIFPPDTVCIGVNDLPDACVWPTHYLVRPQLLSRL
jgi:hypothetical protein